MSALRVARGFTGRDKIIKIDGGYHGHADCCWSAAGSGAVTLGIPGSAGVHRGRRRRHAAWSRSTTSTPCAAAFEQHRGEIAARDRRADRRQHGRGAAAAGLPAGAARAVRRARRAADLRRGDHRLPRRARRRAAAVRRRARPDLPGQDRGRRAAAAAIYGGRADVMDEVAPEGPVYQAGTLSGNPLAVAAGHRDAASKLDDAAYVTLEELGRALEDELGARRAPHRRRGARAARRLGVHAVLHARGGRRPGQRQASPTPRIYARFFHGMLERGLHAAAGPVRGGVHLAGPHAGGHRRPSPPPPAKCWPSSPALGK